MTVLKEWRGAQRHQFPGQGVTESFLNRLGSVRRGPGRFVPVHPVLHWPAVRLLHVMGWWHYHIQRNACKDGSRICWQPDHWRDGKPGPLAAEMARQLNEARKNTE